MLISQKTKLITNIEKLIFWIGDNQKLHFAKQDLLQQINNLDISINGNDFFIIDRQFLAGVSFVNANEQSNDNLTDSQFFFQLAAVCCTYIIIFIQFYLEIWFKWMTCTARWLRFLLMKWLFLCFIVMIKSSDLQDEIFRYGRDLNSWYEGVERVAAKVRRCLKNNKISIWLS